MKPQLSKLRKQSKRVASLFSAIALGVSSQLSMPQSTQAQVAGVTVGAPSLTVLDDGCIAGGDPDQGDTITISTTLTNTTGIQGAFRVVFRARSNRGGTSINLPVDLLYGGPTYMSEVAVGSTTWSSSFGQVTNTPIIANGGSYQVRANLSLLPQQLANALNAPGGTPIPLDFTAEVFSSDFKTYYGSATTSKNIIYRAGGGKNAVTCPSGSLTSSTSVLLTASKTIYGTNEDIVIEESTMGAGEGNKTPSWGDDSSDTIDIVRLDVPPTGNPELDYSNNSANVLSRSAWTNFFSPASGSKTDNYLPSNFYHSQIVGTIPAWTNYTRIPASSLDPNKHYLVRVRPRLGSGGLDPNAGTSSHPVQRPQWNYFAVGTPAPIGAPQADLVTTKTGPTTAIAGSTVTYTLTTINNGPNAASNVVVSDNIGIGLTNVVPSNGGTYNSTTGIVTFPGVSLANGATLTYTVSVTAPASGTLTDIVSSTSTTNDPTPANNDGTAANAKVTTNITPSADVVTTKTGPTTAVAGSTVTYTLTARNNGPSTATNVVVSDNIGIGLSGVTASNGGVYNSSTGIVTFPAIASLANGATQTYTVSVIAPTNGGTLTDIVSSTSSTSDPTPANNNGTAANAQVTTTVTPSADLVTTKTGPTTAVAGSTVTYNLTAVNNGPSAATNVVVSDNIGTGLTGVTASNGGVYNSSTGIVTFPTVASLANGATLNYTVSVTAPASGTLTDVVSSASTTSDPTPANNNGTAANARVTTAITSSADVVTTKTGPTTAIAGSTVTYTLTAVNNGPSAATNVVVSDNIGTGLTGVTASNGGVYNSSTGIVTFPAIASLANGATQTYTVSLTAPANGGTLTDIVSSTSDTTDPTATNNNGTATNAKVTTTVTPSADLSINKTDGQTTALPGSPITYTVTVTNNGPSSVAGASITDTVPSSITGVTWTCSASSGSSCSAASGTGNTINTAVNLLSGGTATYTVKGTVSPTATGSIVNTASVAVPSGVTDPNTSNNSSTDTDTITPTADLSINKTDGQTSVAPGGSVVYTITVTNNGPSTLSSVTVTDNLPAEIQNPVFTTTTGTYNSSTGVWTGLNLATGQSVVLTLSGTISPSATGSVTNTATVAAPTGVTDPNPSNNSSTDIDTVTVTPAQLRLVKRITSINGTDVTGFVDDPNSVDDNATKWPGPTTTSLRGAINGGLVRPGDEVEYTIYFLSDGGSDAKNVTFCDLVPKNQTLVPNAFNSVTPASGGTLGSDRSMIALINGTQVSYTNIADGDTGRFYTSGTAVPVPIGGQSPQPCPATNTSTNGNGAIVVNLGNVPKVPNSGSSTASYGFVRFRAKVD